MPKAEARKLVKEILGDAANLAAKLRELRERAGWKSLGHDSWAACVEAEFGYSKRYANYMIEADQVRERVGTIVPTSIVIPESHTRELGRLPEDQQADCFKDAVEDAAKRGEKLTADKLGERIDTYLKADEPYVEPPEDDGDAEAPEPTDTERDKAQATARKALGQLVRALDTLGLAEFAKTLDRIKKKVG
jgi:hypothetical protein